MKTQMEGERHAGGLPPWPGPRYREVSCSGGRMLATLELPGGASSFQRMTKGNRRLSVCCIYSLMQDGVKGETLQTPDTCCDKSHFWKPS